jgi:hypothetical protein
MKTRNKVKKAWSKPIVSALKIRRDTFSGSGYGGELAGKSDIPVKS